MDKKQKGVSLQNTQSQQESLFPPVVSVLGHVDHGKTTLLDRLRKTSIAKAEHGGITQRIGASEVEVLHEEKKRRIVFIDTPGHEAFSNMRSQGVSGSDMALLIVAADDGVMPQTIESIKKIKEATLPYIVVITKIDLEHINLEKTLGELSKQGVSLEGRGGTIPYITVSSKTGENIEALLGLILLAYDLSAIKKDKKAQFYGVVIDSRHDKKMGIVATIVVKQGILKKGDVLFLASGESVGKVRALINTYGRQEDVMFPGDAVEILGFTKVIPAGSIVGLEPSQTIVVQPIVSKKTAPVDVLSFLEEVTQGALRVLLKTETSAELEAVKKSLPEEVEIVFQGQGEISVSDVMLAKDLSAIIIGFNISIAKEAKRLCESEGILYRIYHVIYELLDEIEDTLDAFHQQQKEVVLGRASILAVFHATDGNVIGARLLEGKISLHDTVKVMRGAKEIGKAKIASLKRGKESVKSVEKGSEFGVLLSPQIDFRVGDVLLSYRT